MFNKVMPDDGMKSFRMWCDAITGKLLRNHNYISCALSVATIAAYNAIDLAPFSFSS